MTDWKRDKVHLLIPRELVKQLAEIAEKEWPPKTWSDKAREIIYSYVAMHRARGAVD